MAENHDAAADNWKQMLFITYPGLQLTSRLFFGTEQPYSQDRVDLNL